jgi:hypothetical protein
MPCIHFLTSLFINTGKVKKKEAVPKQTMQVELLLILDLSIRCSE